MLRRHGTVTAVLGAIGGRGQPQVLAQLLMRLAAGRAPPEALAAPRWVVGNDGQGDEIVVLAEGAVPDQGRGALAAAGLPLVIGAQPELEAVLARYVGTKESLLAHVSGITNPVVCTAAMVYFWTRVVHAAAYTYAVPWVRTLGFAVGFFTQAAIAWVLLVS